MNSKLSFYKPNPSPLRQTKHAHRETRMNTQQLAVEFGRFRGFTFYSAIQFVTFKL